jgi:hypothetical protein
MSRLTKMGQAALVLRELREVGHRLGLGAPLMVPHWEWEGRVTRVGEQLQLKRLGNHRVNIITGEVFSETAEVVDCPLYAAVAG